MGSGTNGTPIPGTITELKKGDFVKIKSGAKYYGLQSTVPDTYRAKTWLVISLSGDRVVVLYNKI